ncbi:MAG: LysM peptidoglycan-binding domain-containing protein [Acidobacteriota bacterium]
MSLSRTVGWIVLLVALVVGAVWLPATPTTAEGVIQRFRFDDELCRELFSSREQTTYTVPDDADAPRRIDEIARRYGVELQLVCSANELTADCGATSLAVGETLILPLDRRAVP